MSFDLVYPGKDTQAAVQTLEDLWIVSGPIRATAHLANVWWALEPKRFKRETTTSFTFNGKGAFGPNELSHPWTKWALQNERNYAWLYFYATDMCEEYVRRFPHLHRHGIVYMLKLFEDMPEGVPEGEWVEPTFAAGVKFES